MECDDDKKMAARLMNRAMGIMKKTDTLKSMFPRIREAYFVEIDGKTFAYMSDQWPREMMPVVRAISEQEGPDTKRVFLPADFVNFGTAYRSSTKAAFFGNEHTIPVLERETSDQAINQLVAHQSDVYQSDGHQSDHQSDGYNSIDNQSLAVLQHIEPIVKSQPPVGQSLVTQLHKRKFDHSSRDYLLPSEVISQMGTKRLTRAAAREVNWDKYGLL